MQGAWLSLYGKPGALAAQVDPARGRVRLGAVEYAQSELLFEAPIAGAVYGTALNFRGALAALGAAVSAPPYQAPPRTPILYLKPRNTWVGHGAPVYLPAGHQTVALGPTLGVLIGRPATRVAAAKALEHVAGYTVVNDLALPHSSYFRPAIQQQCRDGFCPIGPWIMSAAAIADPDALAIRAYVNDRLCLQSSTAQMIRPLRQLIAEVTSFMTLRSGDLLLVGLPENLPEARSGDLMSIEIEGLGRLQNRLVAEPSGVGATPPAGHTPGAP
jgi:5-oxopent-3-ene-1,2,5-tricarboxylate decarboxylase / 2-hydroxyhepta-2,4-diene-1,7-dioate isomerase